LAATAAIRSPTAGETAEFARCAKFPPDVADDPRARLARDPSIDAGRSDFLRMIRIIAIRARRENAIVKAEITPRLLSCAFSVTECKV